MNKNEFRKEQEIYGDIPLDGEPLSTKYLDAVLPDHVKKRLAERGAPIDEKNKPKKEPARAGA